MCVCVSLLNGIVTSLKCVEAIESSIVFIRISIRTKFIARRIAVCYNMGICSCGMEKHRNTAMSEFCV